MRRAKIQVKPNLGNKTPSGSAATVKKPDDIQPTESDNSAAISLVSDEHPIGESSQETNEIGRDAADSVGSAIPAIAEELSSAVNDQSAGSVDVPCTASVSGCVVDSVSSSCSTVIIQSTVSTSTVITADSSVSISSSADAHEGDSLQSMHIVPSADSSLSCSSNLTAPKVPARRLKSSWKPNVAKASADASAVRSVSTTALNPPVPEPVPNLEVNSSSHLESVSTSTAPSSSSIEASCDVDNSSTRNTDGLHTSVATDTVDNAVIHQRTADGLASPTSVLRRGKFMAKPNVAKASRVR
jgi:hypothetical protein